MENEDKTSTSRRFIDREIGLQGHLVHKLKAKDSTGEWAYYYVHVLPHRERDFMAAISGDGMIDLEDFGRVIASCYGEVPSQETLKFLEKAYGFRPNP